MKLLLTDKLMLFWGPILVIKSND